MRRIYERVLKIGIQNGRVHWITAQKPDGQRYIHDYTSRPPAFYDGRPIAGTFTLKAKRRIPILGSSDKKKIQIGKLTIGKKR